MGGHPHLVSRRAASAAVAARVRAIVQGGRPGPQWCGGAAYRAACPHEAFPLRREAAQSYPHRRRWQLVPEPGRKSHPAPSGACSPTGWAVVWLTQLVFYGLPWLQWGERQMVLFDLGGQALLPVRAGAVPAGLHLPHRPAHFGAVAVPVHGGGGADVVRLRLPADGVHRNLHVGSSTVSRATAARPAPGQSALDGQDRPARAGQNAAWIAVALWTGFTFVGYFVPIRQPGRRAASLQGPGSFLGVLLRPATYGNAGFMREQVCKYMCPYARFQSAMFDKDTLIVTYDTVRGEPRGARGRGRPSAGLGAASTALCVQVCPTGIDCSTNALAAACAWTPATA